MVVLSSSLLGRESEVSVRGPMHWGNYPKAPNWPPVRFDTVQQTMVLGKWPQRREQYKATLPELLQPFESGAEASLRAPKQGPTYCIKLPETNSLHLSVPVADIKAIVTGKDCPHMKEKSALKQNKVSGEADLTPESESLSVIPGQLVVF